MRLWAQRDPALHEKNTCEIRADMGRPMKAPKVKEIFKLMGIFQSLFGLDDVPSFDKDVIFSWSLQSFCCT